MDEDMRSRLLALATELEQATAGTFELDCAIHLELLPDTFFGRKVVRWYREDRGPKVVRWYREDRGPWYGCETDDGFLHFQASKAPPYTASIDAALSLVPEGYGWEIYNTTCSPPHVWAKVYGGSEAHRANTSSPALALAAAALRARSASAERDSAKPSHSKGNPRE